MLQYFTKRILYMIPTLFFISLVSFFIIQLPPGDYVTTLAANFAAQGEAVDDATVAQLRRIYGLDRPIHIQYFLWISKIIFRGDFGQSFDWGAPVSDLIWGRLGLTLMISTSTLLFIWAVALPIGIYSAVNKYSVGDYIATFVGFIGLAVPNFLLALILMYIGFRYFGQSVGGLFSPEYIDAPWSWGKFVDLLAHLWIPVVVIGTAGTAGLIRIMRANLLDELFRPYVTTARAKGLKERSLLAKYPVRLALNPFISTVGWVLPSLISGDIIVSVVLGLPTTGPLLLRALLAQDMYLAGAFILLLSVLTVVGTLISDLLLAALDPRIRYG
ncbi:MAG: ABC transporter permease [Deinococcota bacterium]